MRAGKSRLKQQGGTGNFSSMINRYSERLLKAYAPALLETKARCGATIYYDFQARAMAGLLICHLLRLICYHESD